MWLQERLLGLAGLGQESLNRPVTLSTRAKTGHGMPLFFRLRWMIAAKKYPSSAAAKERKESCCSGFVSFFLLSKPANF